MLINKLTKEEYNLINIFIDSKDEEYINRKIINIKEHLLSITTNNKKIQETKDIPVYKKGKGLTIGNVCSQILSIFYLSELDHYIIHKLKCKYMIRYFL